MPYLFAVGVHQVARVLVVSQRTQLGLEVVNFALGRVEGHLEREPLVGPQHALMHVLVLSQSTVVLVYLQTNKSQSDISVSILVQFGITVNNVCCVRH